MGQGQPPALRCMGHVQPRPQVAEDEHRRPRHRRRHLHSLHMSLGRACQNGQRHTQTKHQRPRNMRTRRWRRKAVAGRDVPRRRGRTSAAGRGTVPGAGAERTQLPSTHATITQGTTAATTPSSASRLCAPQHQSCIRERTKRDRHRKGDRGKIERTRVSVCEYMCVSVCLCLYVCVALACPVPRLVRPWRFGGEL
jgi:hypothetical protein